jgi:hypothetical protein
MTKERKIKIKIRAKFFNSFIFKYLLHTTTDFFEVG